MGTGVHINGGAHGNWVGDDVENAGNVIAWVTHGVVIAADYEDSLLTQANTVQGTTSA